MSFSSHLYFHLIICSSILPFLQWSAADMDRWQRTKDKIMRTVVSIVFFVSNLCLLLVANELAEFITGAWVQRARMVINKHCTSHTHTNTHWPQLFTPILLLLAQLSSSSSPAHISLFSRSLSLSFTETEMLCECDVHLEVITSSEKQLTCMPVSLTC